MIATVLCGEHELPADQHVWGTGGWLPPEQREALDWLTLLKLLGWQPVITRESKEQAARIDGAAPFVIVALEPDEISDATVIALEQQLAHMPILVITRAAAPGSALARLAGVARASGNTLGKEISWSGPGPERNWQCRAALEARALSMQPDIATWATLDGAPLIGVRRVGPGVIATLAFHPSAARDADGVATALLRHLLVCGTEPPVTWLDFDGTVVLRMDDPGGAQNVYSRTWHHQKLDRAGWAALGADLHARQARLAIAYVSGWVDDGNAQRGDLLIDGVTVERRAGAVHPSPVVLYTDKAGHAPGTVHDYQAEYDGIEALRRAGLADVELHGYTHIHPDAERWSAAPDMYESMSWYRELGADAASVNAKRTHDDHPLSLACRVFQQYFDMVPLALVSPGDEWTNEVLTHALSLGIELVDSYYLAMRHDDRFCWAQHVCAPYIDEPAASWFDAGIPVVGYFHDRDIVIHGQQWLSTQLDMWQEAGARRWIDFRELAAALSLRCTVAESETGITLIVSTHARHRPVRDTPICIRFRTDIVPATIHVMVDDVITTCDVIETGAGVGRVRIPAQ